MFTTNINLAVATVIAAVLAGPMLAEENPPKGTTVNGRVASEPGGNGVAGVLVTLWDGSGGERSTARTDATGAYSFADVKPGDYYKVWIEERPGQGAGIWSEAVVVRVEDRPVRADDLFVELPQSVSGTVSDVETGKPVAGAEINFSTADGNRDAVKTDRNGGYRLFVTPRDVDLYCNGTDTRYDASQQQHHVAVGAGKHLENIDFKVKSAPPFTGRVVLPDGKPAKKLDVYVEMNWTPLNPGSFSHGGFGRTFQLQTDDEGRFSGYMVGILSQGGAQTVELLAIARLPDHTLGGTVQAKTDAEYRVDPLKLVLARTSGVMVHIVNPDGKPITDAKLSASQYRGWESDWDGPGQTDRRRKVPDAGSDSRPGISHLSSIRGLSNRVVRERTRIEAGRGA